MRILQGLGWLALVGLAGCHGSRQPEVVVYTALDAEFSEPLLEAFERRQAIVVRANFDVESTKTVGLTTRILQERRRPRCDVFWNNEILHTLRLQQQGLLEPYVSPVGQQLPPNYRSAKGDWYGFAARARVLLANTERVAEGEYPDSILDLVDPKWQGRVGIAKPLFGTTATHASVLFSSWGSERAEEFFRDLKDNARVMSGNKQVAQAVSAGTLAFGLTDTDDAIIELEGGHPVRIIYPDQQEGGMGTLFIPNTVCLIKGGPNPRQARALVDYLLSDEVETQLARGPSAQFPVRPGVSVRSRVAPAEPVRWMEVDFARAAGRWDEVAVFLRELFATGS